MSSDYSILVESNNSLEVIKDELEHIINFPLHLVEEWEYFEMYSIQLMGLWIQLHEFRKLGESVEDEFSRYNYQIQVGFLGNLIDPNDGRAWVHTSCVELARMITRNTGCDTAVVKNYVVTHTFLIERNDS